MRATALAAVFLLAVAILPAFMAIEGLVTGTVRARGGRCSRAQQPVLFWFVMATNVVLMAWLAYLALRLAIAI